MKMSPPISEHDAKIIAQIVELFPLGNTPTVAGYQNLKMHILRIFGQDITPDHFIMLGQVIGIKALTDKNKSEKINHISYGRGYN